MKKFKQFEQFVNENLNEAKLKISGPAYDLWNDREIQKGLRNIKVKIVGDIGGVMTLSGSDEELQKVKDLLGLNEAKRGTIHKAAKNGSYPAVVVVIENGKVIHQEKVVSPEHAPAVFNVMQEKYPKAKLSLEDKTGQILFQESVNEYADFNDPILIRMRQAQQHADDKKKLDAMKKAAEKEARRNRPRWTQKKYDKWLEMAASNGGAENAFDMAKNAEFEPGLIDWVEKKFGEDDPLQRIQWDIEGFAESTVNEAKNTIGLAFKDEGDYNDFIEFCKEEGAKIRKDIGEDKKTKSWEVIMDIKELEELYGEVTPGNNTSGWLSIKDDFDSVIIESAITEKREDVGKYNTVKKVIAKLGRRPSEQELATFINNNYYDVTEVERGDDDPAANDKIADLVAFYKFDIDDWEIAWADAQNESVVTEAKKITIKDIEKAWNSVYGEDFEQDYSSAYGEIMGKYKGKITKAELAALWYNKYSEDLQSEYAGFFDSLEESVVNEASKDRMIKQIERALKDGTSIFKLPMATQKYYYKNKSDFESVVTEAKMPNKYIGNDEIVFLKTKEDSKGANYNLYYKGHDIEYGGVRFGSEKELKNFADDYGLSNQWYNKLKYADSKPLPESTYPVIRKEHEEVYHDKDFLGMQAQIAGMTREEWIAHYGTPTIGSGIDE